VAEIIPIEYLRHTKRKPRRRPVRIRPEALMELIGRHSFCVLDQHQPSRCPPAMAWELNVYFGVANEEDKGFRRCDEMPAAKPLSDHSAVEGDPAQWRKEEGQRLADSMFEEDDGGDV
jgi:hypothetical protein